MGGGGGGGGWGVGRGGRERRALLFCPPLAAASPLTCRSCVYFSRFLQMESLLSCSTMLKKIENHDCAFVVSNLYFKLICTSRSCFMTRNLRDSSPFRVAIDARRKKTREKASILKRVKEPPARPTHTLA